jgi:DNA-binding IclR family transcriptional regulator
MEDRAIKSAERTIALFELFSATEIPMTVSEIANALDIPQSSTTMLLRNLTAI